MEVAHDIQFPVFKLCHESHESSNVTPDMVDKSIIVHVHMCVYSSSGMLLTFQKDKLG